MKLRLPHIIIFLSVIALNINGSDNKDKAAATFANVVALSAATAAL